MHTANEKELLEHIDNALKDPRRRRSKYGLSALKALYLSSSKHFSEKQKTLLAFIFFVSGHGEDDGFLIQHGLSREMAIVARLQRRREYRERTMVKRRVWTRKLRVPQPVNDNARKS